MTEDESIVSRFSFLLEQGFAFERDYSKGTDSTCTQIYRFRKDGANYLEYRVLSDHERTLLVCVRGDGLQIGEFIEAEIEKTSLRCLFARKI